MSALTNSRTLEARLQAIVDDAVQNGKVPALTFGTLYRSSSGEVQRAWASAGSLPLAQEGATVDLTPDTTLAVYSCAKLVVAIAVMQLVERGELELDQDVAGILPDLIANGLAQEDGSRKPLPEGTKVTVRMLLTHTSGLPYNIISRKLHAWHAKQTDEYRAKFPLEVAGWDYPFVTKPGTEWAYSYAFDWLGRLIARKTGVTLEQYVQKNIAEPLGVFFGFEQPTDTPIPQWGFFLPPGAPTSVQWIGPFPMVTLGLEDNGGAGGVTTMRSFIEIVAILANGGVGLKTGNRILQEETVKDMLKDALVGRGLSVPDVIESAMPMLVLDDREVPVRHDSGIKKSWAIAGQMNLEPLKNGRAPGSIFWGGVAGLYWSVNPTTGTVCVSGSQVLPFGDPRTLDPFLTCEGEVISAVQA